MEDLTPRRIVAELDKYIVGQAAAKRAVAIALRNRFRRRMLDADLREEVIPKNILMIGPTGVGKTEIARRLARLANAPFLKIEATKFTEVGYVGRDVESIVRDLVHASFQMVEQERTADVRERAEEAAKERLLDLIHPVPSRDSYQANLFGGMKSEDEERFNKRVEQAQRIRARLKEQLELGALESRMVEIEVEESGPAMASVFGPPGMEEMTSQIQDMLSSQFGGRKRQRALPISEAREVLIQEEARKLVDPEAVKREAVERAEQDGVVFLDEIDKIAQPGTGHGPDVSRGGVQRDILPIIEGSTVQTKYGPVRTDHMLFIAAGAFHISKPSDLIPELQGRLPIRVELESLTEDDFRRILTEPENALTRQYVALLAVDGVELEYTEDGIAEIARVAADVNRTTENIGARRLHTIMERLLEDVAFGAPEEISGPVKIDAAYVQDKLDAIAADQDLSRYIL